MGIARKLALTVVAVVAVNVSTASAIEVTEEPPMGATNGSHCSTVVIEEQASRCHILGFSVGYAELGLPLGITIYCGVTVSDFVSEGGRIVTSNYDWVVGSCEDGSLIHDCTGLPDGHRHPTVEPATNPAGFPIPIETQLCYDVELPLDSVEATCHLGGTLERIGATPSHQYELNFTHSTSQCQDTGGDPTGTSFAARIRTPPGSNIEILP
jgi:hypothetical protein